MSDPKKGPSSSSRMRGILINGVCLVPIVVGLALVSNRLLDMAGVANAQGFTVEQRNEKNSRNQTEYEREEIKPTKVGWFSSDKYDCENQQVIETVKSQLVCDKLLVCSGFGFQDLSEVLAATPQQIDRHKTSFVQNVASESRQLQQSNPSMYNWFVREMGMVADDRRKLFGLAPRFLEDVTVVADDFNPQIGKYVCHMTYRYNEAVFVPFWDAQLRLNLLQDPTAQAVAQAELSKGQDTTTFEITVKMGMQKFRAYESAQERRIETLRFTVQPSQQSRFVVQVGEMHMPGGRLIDN